MDWPPQRRTSYARREQNLALIGTFVTGAVIAVAVLLLLLSRVNPAYTTRLRSGAIDAVAPFWATVRAPFDWLGGATDTIGDYIATVPRNRVLTADLARARIDLQDRDRAVTENIALKKLLHVIEPRSEIVAVARFAGASSGSYARTAMVAAGHANGVYAGMGVRADAGLVGRTVEAGEHAARILLLTDTNSRVPVIIVRTGQPALAIGAAGRLLEVRDRLGAEVPLRVGDRLVTSGAGGLFAPQIPVAVVTDAAEPPHALPYADPASLSYVAIARAYLPIPAQAEAPPVDAVPVPREARKR